MILENVRQNIFISIFGTVVNTSRFQYFEALFFPIEDSYAYFLIVCKVYTGVLDRGRNEKNEKTIQIILAYGDRRHFELRL